ncbi:MAG: (5-formylfuran-3-yl)methyl phosphate synthase [Rubripirellula sp.]
MLPAPTPDPQFGPFGEAVGSGESRVAELLVSVRDPQELLDASESQVAIVDLKEPKRGPLAAADTELWSFAATLWGRDKSLSARSRLSAALGEPEEARSVAGKLPSAFEFAKVGPSGCGVESRLRKVWEDIVALLPSETELVGVAYADADAAGCLPPEEVFHLAKNAGLRRCLVDTFTKDGRSTIDHLGFQRLRDLDAHARRLGLWWALAGSIRCESVCEIQRQGWMPDCFGVRGDVCVGDRTAVVSKARIDRWVEQLQTARLTLPSA